MKMCDCNQGRLPCTCKIVKYEEPHSGPVHGDAIGTLVRVYNERIVFTPIGDPHIIDDMKVYSHPDSGEVERPRAEVERLEKSLTQALSRCADQGVEAATELAERDALLRDIDDWMDREDRTPGFEIERRMAQVFASASAEPSAPKCKYCGDTGQIMVGRSGDANDGNAPILEPCEDCDRGAPVERDDFLDGLCPFCIGSGSVATGITESPSTICEECGGAGKPRASLERKS